jgi:hypothetical protein
VSANKSIGEGGSVKKMLVERAELSIYVDGMGPIWKKAGWGRWNWWGKINRGLAVRNSFPYHRDSLNNPTLDLVIQSVIIELSVRQFRNADIT